MIPVRFLLIFWLFVLSAVAFLDRTNISIAGNAISDEYHLGNIRLGWVFSAFLIGYAVFQVVGGWLAGRMGPRRLLTLGVVWWGIFTALTAAVPTKIAGALFVLIAVRFALGAGEAVVYPASNQFVARWIPVQERGKANGWIFAGVGAGAGLTPPFLAWLIGHHGWRASFWFSAIVGLVAGGVWYALCRDTPEEHPYVLESELATIQSGLPPASSAQSANSDASGLQDQPSARTRLPWKKLFTSREILALTFSYFTYGYVAWIFFSWFTLYLMQARGLNLKSSAVYTMLPSLAMTLCCLCGGILNDWLARRYGLRTGRCFLGCFSLMAAAVFLGFGSTIHSTQFASIVLAGGAGALYLSQSSYWSVTVDVAGVHSGVASGLMNMGCQIGGALTASLTPILAKHYGWTASFVVAASLSALGGLDWLLVDPARSLAGPTELSPEMGIGRQYEVASSKPS